MQLVERLMWSFNEDIVVWCRISYVPKYDNRATMDIERLNLAVVLHTNIFAIPFLCQWDNPVAITMQNIVISVSVIFLFICLLKIIISFFKHFLFNWPDAEYWQVDRNPNVASHSLYTFFFDNEIIHLQLWHWKPFSLPRIFFNYNAEISHSNM